MIQRKSVRQQYALDSGANVVLDSGEVDVVAEIKKLTKGIVGSICRCDNFPATIARMADGCIKADRYITKRGRWMTLLPRDLAL